MAWLRGRLAALAALLAAAAAWAAGGASAAGAPQGANVVLFVSIPLPGHVAPLAIQAAELRRRGWDAVVLSSPTARRVVEAYGVPFVAAGEGSSECAAAEAAYRDVAKESSLDPDFLRNAVSLWRWTFRLWPCLYDSLLDTMTAIGGRDAVALVVGDVMSVAAFDAADALGVPWSANNADLSYLLSSPAVLPVADDLPPPLSGVSVHAAGRNLVQRVANPVARPVIRAALALGPGAELNAQRARRGVAPGSVYRLLQGRLVICTTAVGLEYSRPLPPLVRMVGPMIDPDELRDARADDGTAFGARRRRGRGRAANAADREEDVRAVGDVPLGAAAAHAACGAGEGAGEGACQAGGDDEARLLAAAAAAAAAEAAPVESDDEVVRWIERSGEPAVLASMGTLATLTDAQIDALREAFGAAGAETGFRVVWKVKEGAERARRGLDPDRVLVVPRVPSQVGLLAHRQVRAFFSHCGVNSAHESALFGTPLLCVPMFADQLDMAQRVVDAGVGLRLDKTSLRADDVRAALRRLVSGELAAASSRVASLVHLAGGVTRAADLLEHVAQHGTDGLVPPSAAYDDAAELGLDVALVWLALAAAAYAAARLAAACVRCCCCRPCCRRAAGVDAAAPNKPKRA